MADNLPSMGQLLQAMLGIDTASLAGVGTDSQAKPQTPTTPVPETEYVIERDFDPLQNKILSEVMDKYTDGMVDGVLARMDGASPVNDLRMRIDDMMSGGPGSLSAGVRQELGRRIELLQGQRLLYVDHLADGAANTHRFSETELYNMARTAREDPAMRSFSQFQDEIAEFPEETKRDMDIGALEAKRAQLLQSTAITPELFMQAVLMKPEEKRRLEGMMARNPGALQDIEQAEPAPVLADSGPYGAMIAGLGASLAIMKERNTDPELLQLITDIETALAQDGVEEVQQLLADPATKEILSNLTGLNEPLKVMAPGTGIDLADTAAWGTSVQDMGDDHGYYFQRQPTPQASSVTASITEMLTGRGNKR